MTEKEIAALIELLGRMTPDELKEMESYARQRFEQKPELVRSITEIIARLQKPEREQNIKAKPEFITEEDFFTEEELEELERERINEADFEMDKANAETCLCRDVRLKYGPGRECITCDIKNACNSTLERE